MAQISLGISIPELDDFSQSDASSDAEGPDPGVFERSDGWDAFQSGSASRSGSPSRRSLASFPSSPDRPALNTSMSSAGQAPGDDWSSAIDLAGVIAGEPDGAGPAQAGEDADMRPSPAKMATLEPAAQHMSDVISLDVDLASFLSSSKKTDSSYKAISSAYASRLDGKGAPATPKAVRPGGVNLSLTLPNPVPPAFGSSTKAVLSFPPTTWANDSDRVRASAVSPLAAIRPSAEPPRSGSTEPKPRMTPAPPSPTRDFRQILNDKVVEVSVAEAARNIEGGAPVEVNVVPRPPEGVKRMSRKRRNLHKNRKANRAANKKPSPKVERAEAAAPMVTAPIAASAAPSPAEIAKDVATAEAVATTKAAKEAVTRRRASVQSRMHDLSTQAIFHHAGSYGAAVPSCANADSANPKTVLRFLTGKLATKQLGALIEVLLAWLPGTQAPGNKWLSVCSVALVAERDCRVLLAVAELHAPIDAVIGYFETIAVADSKLKLGDVLDVKVGQSGTSDLLGEPSSLWHFGEEPDAGSGVNVDNTTVMLIPSSSFVRAGVLRGILARADTEHFDIAGLRLLFPTADQLADPSSVDFFLGRSQASVAFLAVALRAPRNTVVRWSDTVGPLDPLIAKQTDPGSIRALHGRDKDDRVLFCARGQEQAKVQLAKWFGRRFDTSAECVVSDRGRKFLSTLPSETAVLFVERDACLQCFPGLVDLLTDTGFTISGVARSKIAPAEVSKLGVTLRNADAKKKWDGFVWKVTKENAAHFAKVLLQDKHGALGQLGITAVQAATAAYSPAVDAMIEKLEETPSNDLISRRMDKQAQALQNWGASTPYAVVVSVFPAAVGGCAAWLRQLLCPGALPPLRMVASKWLSQVRSHQAKELTPFEVGDRGYRPSVAKLQGGSVQLLVLYGPDAFERTKAVLEGAYGDRADSQALVAPTALLAWRQLATFFFDRDVHLTPEMHGPELPELDMALRPLILNLTLTPRPIKTLAVLKADCTAQQITKSLQAIKRAGLKIVRLKYTRLSDETATLLMASSPTQFPDADGRAAYAAGLTGSPMWTMALEHVNAVAAWQDLMGSPDPVIAKECPAFTLRGVFGGDRVKNKLFGSESYASAQGELDALFATVSSGIYPVVGSSRNSGRFGMNEVPGQQRTTVLLRETACVVLTPLLLAKLSFADVLDFVVEQGFSAVACTMVEMSRETAAAYMAMDGREQRHLHTLTQGKSIVMGLERDNAVTCSRMLLCRDLLEHHYGVTLFASATVSASEAALGLFFAK